MPRSRKVILTCAIADFCKAIELDPNDGEVYVGRGHAKQSKGDWIGAVLDYFKGEPLKYNAAHERKR